MAAVNTTPHFTPGPLEPALTDADLHIWLIHVDGQSHCVDDHAAFLVDDEMTRARRFVFERDRRRFITTRGCLRGILSRYLRVPPAELRFSYNHFGKPSLAPHHGSEVSFNLSHSDELAICAVASRLELGIDIERLRDMRGEDIAGRFFTPEEQNALSTLPSELRRQGFFNCWTRKEAWLKAIGRGIGMGLDQVVVSLRPDEPVEFRRIGTQVEQAREWSLLSFTPATEYIAAVAFQGQAERVHYWSW